MPRGAAAGGSERAGGLAGLVYGTRGVAHGILPEPRRTLHRRKRAPARARRTKARALRRHDPGARAPDDLLRADGEKISRQLSVDARRDVGRGDCRRRDGACSCCRQRNHRVASRGRKLEPPGKSAAGSARNTAANRLAILRATLAAPRSRVRSRLKDRGLSYADAAQAPRGGVVRVSK